MSDPHVTIEAMGRRGEGLAHHDGEPVFLPRTLPGEEVAIRQMENRWTVAALLRPSPDRIDAFCPHYDACGGCQLQHWNEAPYRAWKTGLVEQTLAAQGITATVRELIDAHGAGRRRVSIHVRRRDGTVTAGFMAARTHNLLDIDRCPVLVPQLDRALDVARAIGAHLGDCDVALTATDTGIDASVKAERQIVAREHGRLAGLANSLGLARLAVNAEVIAAPAVPRIIMGAAAVSVPPGAFLQATAEGEEVLARLVLEGVGKAKTVADLFCGCGPFALRLARRAAVEAYDSDRPAIAALAAAVRQTPGLKPLTAAVRDLFREPLVPNEMKAMAAVVFDPPRAGAEAQARQLARSKVATVVAVSCDPQTFARDAAILLAGGYALTRLMAVDQFKWTSHVEVVAVFNK